MNKEINWKTIITGLVIVLMLFANLGFIFAETSVKDQAVEKGKQSLMESVFKQGGNLFQNIVGGPSWMKGVVAGGLSAYNTYNQLGKEISFTMEQDKVNISSDKGDYIDEDNLEYLEINTNTEDLENADLVLTDKNVLDIDYINTSSISEYVDLENNPSMRVSEFTEFDVVVDTNDQRVEGQTRGLLFEDPNETIERSFEFRNLLFRYDKLLYKDQPIDVKLSFNDLIGWFNIFDSGASKIKDEVKSKAKGEVQEEREPKGIIQKFHLLFNSRTDETEEISLDQLDCTTIDGKVLGTTGTDILPKIAYNWSFQQGNDVEAVNGTTVNTNNWCDFEKDGVFCDATQFTIEVLNKIDLINQYVSNNHLSFECPMPGIEDDIVTDINNVGLSYLSSVYDKRQNVVVDYTIEGGYEVPSNILPHILDKVWFDANVCLYLKEAQIEGAEIDCETIEITGGDIASGSLTSQLELNLGYYTEDLELATVANLGNFRAYYVQVDGNRDIGDIDLEDTTIIPGVEADPNDTLLIDFDLIENIEVDNKLTNIFGTNSEACSFEKKSTNIPLYSKTLGDNFDDTLVEFKAMLMKDGYSDDFRNDFDELYRTAFIGSPEYYRNESLANYTPLHKYLTNKDLIVFKTKTSDPTKQLVLPGPGRYEVEIVINYDDQWKLFNEAGEPTGTIEIIFNKELGPEHDMPLYYLPIDGVVGVTSVDARQGYGVDYLGDVVSIDPNFNENSGTGYELTTQGFVSSNPINTLNVLEVEDFGVMNNGSERGKLLSINTDSSHSNVNLRYLPSRATPVAMKINNKVNDAYAFYKLAIGAPQGEGGEVAHPGVNLGYWTGLPNCEDFTGIPSIEAHFNIPDLLATESQLAPVTSSQDFAYGVEWTKDEITRVGNVWLHTIFYTPANYETGDGYSRMYLDSYSDKAAIYTPESLSGSESARLDNVFGSTQEVNSIIKIFDLVADKKACVNYDSTHFEVFYNPKKVTDELLTSINPMAYSSTNDSTKCIGYSVDSQSNQTDDNQNDPNGQ